MKTENWKEWNPGVEVTLADDLCVILRNVEFKDEAHIAQVIVDLENLFEQRLLLSSEAEEGECCVEWCGRPTRQGFSFCDEHILHIKEIPTPPLTTKGEQNSAPKEEGEDGRWINGPSYYRSAICDSPDPLLSAVGKSEGEEAVIAEFIDGLHLRTWQNTSAKDGIFYHRDGVIKAIRQYSSLLHSSGDRGRKTLWGCYMEGTDELGISDDILLSVHSTPAGAHENSMRMQKEYGGKHYTDKVVIHA